MHACMYMCICVCVCMCVCVNACMCVCMYVCMFVFQESNANKSGHITTIKDIATRQQEGISVD